MSEKYASVQEAVKYMENAYDRGGKYLVDGRPRYTAHAVRMEDETGLKGIAGRYKFINGQEPAFAEYGYRKRFFKILDCRHVLKIRRSDCPSGRRNVKRSAARRVKKLKS